MIRIGVPATQIRYEFRPQLARLGALHWMGQGFDFADRHGGEPVVRHPGGGYKGACVVRRTALLGWLRRKKLQFV